MSSRKSFFAFAVACAPLFIGCSGAPGDYSETGTVASELGEDVLVRFRSGSTSGMTSGDGTLADTPDDGLLGWRGPMVSTPFGSIQAPAFVFENKGTAPATASATLSWNSFTATQSGSHWVNTPDVYLIAGHLTASALGEAVSADVLLDVEARVANRTVKKASYLVTTVSSSYGKKELSFDKQVHVLNEMEVYANKGEPITYQARLVLRGNSRFPGIAKLAIRVFGTPSISSPNTNVSIRIVQPVG